MKHPTYLLALQGCTAHAWCMVKDFPGRVLRGFRFRLYPSRGQELLIRSKHEILQSCWNWLCARDNDTRLARAAYAEKYHGIIKPKFDKENPESKKLFKAWREQVKNVCDKEPACSYKKIKTSKKDNSPEPADWISHFGVKHDYQIFAHACGAKIEAHYLQALCKNYSRALAATKRGQKPPSPKYNT